MFKVMWPDSYHVREFPTLVGLRIAASVRGRPKQIDEGCVEVEYVGPGHPDYKWTGEGEYQTWRGRFWTAEEIDALMTEASNPVASET